MSPRFAPDDIDTVRDRADLLQIVGEHVRLRKAGQEFVGLCPFHQEKTGSFYVNADKGLYVCRGCGAGGNVFTFVQEIEGLSFTETIEQLASKYGIQLKEITGERRTQSPRARLLAAHEAATTHYQKLLAHKEGASPRAYLEDRGLDEALRARYRIGFGGWTANGLVQALVREGFTAEELIAAGLARQDGRAMRDAFVGRVLFPIFDPSDRAVGFGGRVLPEAFRARSAPENPKYLNTRETSIFHKSKVLYGVNWARGDIVRTRRLILVEGYTDVIALQHAGVPEAVATCGTSLTEQHMQEISRRFGDVKVILCLDGDAAGQAAVGRERTEQLVEAYSPGEKVKGGGWLPVGRGWLPEVMVATLPAGQDPADFAKSSGHDGVEDVLSKAMPLVEFLLRRAVLGAELTSPAGRAQAVRKGADVLAQVGDSLMRHEYAVWLSGRCGVESYEVIKAVEQRAKQPSGSRPAPKGEQIVAPTVLSGTQRVEREALRALVAEPDLMDEAVEDDDFTLPLHRTLFRLLVRERQEHQKLDIARLATDLQDPTLRAATMELGIGHPPDRQAALETLNRLRVFALVRRIEEKKLRLRTLDPEREAQAYDSLFEELLKLERERRALATEGQR